MSFILLFQCSGKGRRYANSIYLKRGKKFLFTVEYVWSLHFEETWNVIQSREKPGSISKRDEGQYTRWRGKKHITKTRQKKHNSHLTALTFKMIIFSTINALHCINTHFSTHILPFITFLNRNLIILMKNNILEWGMCSS